MRDMYEYLCEEHLEFGGKSSAGKLQTHLNQRATEGWQLKAAPAMAVKGTIRIGEGLMLIFERSIS